VGDSRRAWNGDARSRGRCRTAIADKIEGSTASLGFLPRNFSGE
jgi:hypothetical protein